MIKVGNQEITNICVGGTPLKKVCVGSTVVWEKIKNPEPILTFEFDSNSWADIIYSGPDDPEYDNGYTYVGHYVYHNWDVYFYDTIIVSLEKNGDYILNVDVHGAESIHKGPQFGTEPSGTYEITIGQSVNTIYRQITSDYSSGDVQVSGGEIINMNVNLDGDRDVYNTTPENSITLNVTLKNRQGEILEKHYFEIRWIIDYIQKT